MTGPDPESSHVASTVWQVRIATSFAAELEEDLKTLGLDRSEAMRYALGQLHREAQELRMARALDDYYGGARAPLPEGVAALAATPRARAVVRAVADQSARNRPRDT